MTKDLNIHIGNVLDLFIVMKFDVQAMVLVDPLILIRILYDSDNLTVNIE